MGFVGCCKAYLLGENEHFLYLLGFGDNYISTILDHT